MNAVFSKAFKRTSAGNYFGYCNGYYVFTWKRPHGGYCCQIGRQGEWLWSEGFHSSWLRTLGHAKQWAKFKIVPSCKNPYKND